MNDTTKPKWASHYTAEDITRIERVAAWLEAKSYSQAALARLARISPSTLNQMLKGGYATSPTKLLANVEGAIIHSEETTSNAVAVVETSVYLLAVACCRRARASRNFAVFSGFVGVGKTFALKHYATSTPNTYVIEATPTMTPQSLIKLLARVVAGFDGKGSIDTKFSAVVDALRNTDSLLIIDEAETLTPNQLHTLRRIRDLSNIGIVLAGTEHLSGLIKPQHGQFDQIRSRTGFWPETVQQITEDDAAALTQSAFGKEEVSDEVLKRLYQYSKGSARMLVEGLLPAIKDYRKGRELDIKFIDAIAKQALNLKPIVGV